MKKTLKWVDQTTVIFGREPRYTCAALDDAIEEIGEEDKENNYYSLGGDNYKDLDHDYGN